MNLRKKSRCDRVARALSGKFKLTYVQNALAKSEAVARACLSQNSTQSSVTSTAPTAVADDDVMTVVAADDAL